MEQEEDEEEELFKAQQEERIVVHVSEQVRRETVNVVINCVLYYLYTYI